MLILLDHDFCILVMRRNIAAHYKGKSVLQSYSGSLGQFHDLLFALSTSCCYNMSNAAISLSTKPSAIDLVLILAVPLWNSV